MRNLQFAEKEFYHIFNRGVDKRVIFQSPEDLTRFWSGMELFNDESSIGSLERVATQCRHGVSTEKKKLVKFVSYCLNPNHFHFILEPLVDKGIERFMHKLGMGYSKYVNAKYRRSGALFQGSFKAKHIDSNEYLLHVSAYVNLNDQIHGYRHGVSTKSSWEEYTTDDENLKFCDTDIILEQFKSKGRYKLFAESIVKDVIRRKELMQELEDEDVELINIL